MKTLPCIASLTRCQSTDWNDYAIVASNTGEFTLDGRRVSLLSVNLYQGQIADVRWPVSATFARGADEFAIEYFGLETIG